MKPANDNTAFPPWQDFAIVAVAFAIFTIALRFL